MKFRVGKIIILSLLSFIVVIKSVYNYTLFHANNLPIFDGVLNEKSQILRYLAFKNNFSLLERFNQLIYEFEGNPLSPGFGVLIAMLNPSWFANDWDIYIRAFISILIFSCSIGLYLRNRNFDFKDILLILCLIFSLPYFYNYRIGISTYIPELSSGLFLLSGFFLLLTFTSTKRLLYYYFGVSLMLLSVIFRYNFFVYIFFFLIPFIFPVFKIFRSLIMISKLKMVLFTVFIFLLFGVYIYSHLDFFLNYYLKPVSFQERSIYLSFRSFFQFCNTEVTVLGLISFILIFILTNKDNSLSSKKSFLIYPSIFSFLFLVLYMKALEPHIFELIVLFTSPLFLIRINYINNHFKRLPQKYYRVITVMVIVFLNINFISDTKKTSVKLDEYKVSREVGDYLIKENKNLNFLCPYEEIVEIPISVYVYKKTKRWNEASIKFYYHDWNYYDIDKNLKIKTISDYYLKSIENNLDLIVINKEIHEKMKSYRLAVKINRIIFNHLNNNPDFKIVKILKSKFYGDLLFFRKKIQ